MIILRQREFSWNPSGIPYKVKSLKDLREKLDSWNRGNWEPSGLSKEFRTPEIPPGMEGKKEVRDFLEGSLNQRLRGSGGDKKVIDLLKKEKEYIDYIL